MATEGRSSSTSLASSLTDLMTSLMVIFVLLLVATLNNASAEGENTRNKIVVELRNKLEQFAPKGVRVEKDPRDPLVLLVLVPEHFLNFETDKYDISAHGSLFLAEFTPLLVNTTCDKEFRDQISSIVVEGHTDSRGTDEHNLPLSQERSLAVVRQMLTVLGTGPTTQRDCFLDFVSATGRGSRELRLDANGAEDKDLSRRVEFKIRVRSLEQREVRTLLGM